MLSPSDDDVMWVLERLSRLCDFASPEMATYVLAIGSKDDLKEYLEGVVGAGPHVSTFVKDMGRRFPPPAAPAPSPASGPATATDPAPRRSSAAPASTGDREPRASRDLYADPGLAPGRVYTKRHDDDDGLYVVGSQGKGRGGKSGRGKSQRGRGGGGGGGVGSRGGRVGGGLTVKDEEAALEAVLEVSKKEAEAAAARSASGDAAAPAVKAGGVPAPPPLPVVRSTSAGVTAVAAPSRHCTCQATLHGLLCNCLSCGKIICEMEAGHTCTYCGDLLPIADMGKRAISKALKRAQQLSAEHIAQFGLPPELAADENVQRAIAHKDRLLVFDRTSAQRSHVYDDQKDYFTSSSSIWLTDEERIEASRKDAAQRAARERPKKVKISFDFTGRMVAVKDETASPKPADGPPLPSLGPKIGKNASSPSESSSAAATTSSDIRTEGAFLGSGAGVGSALVTVNPDSDEAPTFANSFLTGRAAEIYAALTSGRQSHTLGGTHAAAIPHSSRLQHDLEGTVASDAVLEVEGGYEESKG